MGAVNRVGSQVPKSNLLVVTAAGKLVDVGQINQAQDDVANKPRRRFTNVPNVL